MNAGLANAHDPDVMTIGGIAPLLLAAAPDAFGEAYRAGLMAFQRDAPAPVRPADLGEHARVRARSTSRSTTSPTRPGWTRGRRKR